MKRARVDENQRQIVAALRQAGASVQHLHAVGQGCPDILVGFRGANHLLELKDGSKPPSARGLTDAQLRWHSIWQGQVAIAEDEEQALRIIGAIE